ncbi:hypothetical protein MSAN_01691100 [Mycena sanguinolenta]|uniref:F-box domain-containing protein n=1 Tax=Mycena sanguinolenta TaxID=230812 RepID=A0A8H7CVE4_9AGAR|nr:hypothetical protein MSAN_01691100 [Mycena sanguinolenta]
MPFETLGEDILLRVLCFLRRVHGFDGLRDSQINKPLQHITLTKQLWLFLVQDDNLRGALELPPPNREKLKNHSTEQLIDFVKSAVNGNFSERTTDYHISLGHMQRKYDSYFFPGARYFLLHCREQAGLHIYDVWSSRSVWTRGTPPRAHTQYQIDFAPGNPIVRILLVQANPSGWSMQIEEVDLTTSISRQIFDLGFLAGGLGLSQGFAGDVFLWTMSQSSSDNVNFLLVNWRASTYVVLRRNSSLDECIKLIPGYIISTYHDSELFGQLVLIVTTLDAFSTHWRPLTNSNFHDELQELSQSTAGLPITLKDILAHGGRSDPPIPVKLSVAPSALCRDAYSICVEMEEAPVAGRGQSRTELFYRFIPSSPERECELRRTSSTTGIPSPRVRVVWSGPSVTVSYRQYNTQPCA